MRPGPPPHTTPEHPYWTLASYRCGRHPLRSKLARAMPSRRTAPQPMSESPIDDRPLQRIRLEQPRRRACQRAQPGRHPGHRARATRWTASTWTACAIPGRQYSFDPEIHRAVERRPALDVTGRLAAGQPSQPGWPGTRPQVKAIRPHVNLSAAVWFTYKKTPAMTFATSQGYHDYLPGLAPVADGGLARRDGSHDLRRHLRQRHSANGSVCGRQPHRAAGQRPGVAGGWRGISPFEGIVDRIDYARHRRAGRRAFSAARWRNGATGMRSRPVLSAISRSCRKRFTAKTPEDAKSDLIHEELA